MENDFELGTCTEVQEISDNEVMDVQEAAAFLRCSVATIYRDTSLGTIPCIHKGRRVLFLRSQLLEWLKSMSECVRTVVVEK